MLHTLRRALWCPLLALSLAVPAPAAAQVTTGTIYGRVLDSSRAALPGATVTATNTATATTKATVTGETGDFTLAFLPVGTYDVTIEMPGFKTREETGLEIVSGARVSVTYVLEIGAQQETVTVTSEAPLLNASSAEQDINITAEMVSELPMQNRDISALLNAGTGSSSGGGTISINGLPPRGFTFSVDGVDASPDSEFPSLGLYQNFNYIKGVSVEAVKQVEVSKNIFSAEIGMTVSGNVNIITKSGTNQFRGSAFENFRSGDLRARNFFVKEKQAGTFNQFGGSIGGPIIENRLFFFGAYEGYRDNQDQSFSGNVPSRWVRDRVTAAIPGSQSFFDLWPLPTGPENPGDLQARFTGTNPETRDDNHFVGRVDYNLSPSDYVTARYTRGSPNYLQARLAAGNSRDRRGLNENLSATYTRVFTPTLTSELRFGFNRNSTERVDLIVDAGAVSIDLSGMPGTGGELFIKKGTNWSLEDSWSWVRGRHSIKFGGIARFWRASRINEEQPVYEFGTLSDLLANRADFAEFQFPLSEFLITSWDAGVFVQDDFRLRPDLTLNLGLRWDYSAVPNERDGRLFNREGPFGGADRGAPVIQYRDPDSIWEANYDMFSPRLGFAWTLNEDTVLRGGTGVFYIPFNLFAGPVEIVQNGLGQPVESTLDRADLARLNVRYPDGNAAVLPKVAAASVCDQQALSCPATGFITDSSIDPNRPNPYSLQWTLGVQRRLSETLVADVAYVGNRGRNLTFSPDLNRVDRATGLMRPVSGLGQFRHYSQDEESDYHSLQMSLRRRFADRIGGSINYTLAENTSIFQGDFACCGRNDNPQELDDLEANRGFTPYFRRHRLFADFIVALPLGDSALLRGWQVSGLVDLASGSPLLIRQGTSLSPGGRPDYLGSDPSDAVLGDWDEAPYQYLDRSMFERVPVNARGVLLRPGTAPRRRIIGPGFKNVDLAISKRFQIAMTRLELRADLYNAFNFVNFNDPNTVIESSSFGRITSAGEGRVAQIGARIEF